MTKARTLADNFAADINGITAGTGITGGGTSGTVTITNDMATTITAKGDLLAGTGNATYDNLAAGESGSTLLADSSSSVGLSYSPVGLAQPVINGGMDIWQRGTSGFVGANNATTFAADRWNIYRGVAGSTFSRQTTSDTTNLPFIQYSLRSQRDSGNNSTSDLVISHSIETANSLPFVGRTVTVSFYARAGANFSAASSQIAFVLRTGTGTDQNEVGGFTGAATAISQNVTLTTTWQRFSYTTSSPIASTVTQLGIRMTFTPVGTAGANDWFEVTGVQIDAGSVALPFRRSGGTLQGELAACQRYYYRTTATAIGDDMAFGYTVTSTTARAFVYSPVTMRTAPTALEQSGTAGDYSIRELGAITTCSSVPTFYTATRNLFAVTLTVASGLTLGYGATCRAVNTNAYLGWSAEL